MRRAAESEASIIYRVIFQGGGGAAPRHAEMRVPLRRFADAHSIAGIKHLLSRSQAEAMRDPNFSVLVQLVTRIGMREAVGPLATGAICLGCGGTCSGAYHVSNIMPYLHVPPPDGPFILDMVQACCRGGELARSIGMQQQIRGMI